MEQNEKLSKCEETLKRLYFSLNSVERAVEEICEKDTVKRIISRKIELEQEYKDKPKDLWWDFYTKKLEK